jgi:hypothetical protein
MPKLVERILLSSIFLLAIFSSAPVFAEEVPSEISSEDVPRIAAAADGATTLLAIGNGFVEGNGLMPGEPVGIVLATGLKIAAPSLTRNMQPAEKKLTLQAMTGGWTFAPAWNLCLLTGVGYPVCLAIAATSGTYAFHKEGKRFDREFARKQAEEQAKEVASKEAPVNLAVSLAVNYVVSEEGW